MGQSLFNNFRDCPEVCQIVIKSDPLREAIAELADCFWAGDVRFVVCSRPGYMTLSTGGSTGALFASLLSLFGCKRRGYLIYLPSPREHSSYVICHMSYVTCHMSCVMCNMSALSAQA
jgi:hypothetical protein